MNKNIIERAQNFASQLDSIFNNLNSKNLTTDDRNRKLLELTALEEKITAFYSEFDTLHAAEQLKLRPIGAKLKQLCERGKAGIYKNIPKTEYI